MSARDEQVPDNVLDRTREILVDSLGCAIGGRDCVAADVARAFPARPDGETGVVIGSEGGAAIDIAAFWNTAMIRYLDYSDTIQPGGHPSDMIGALVAMAGSANSSGEDILTAMAVAYEVFTSLAVVADSWTIDQGYRVAVGGAAGIAYMLGLSREQTQHAVSFAATNGTPLRASRSGELSHYKGAATAVSSRHAVFCAHMARSGMTAPSAPFDGRHGIVELLTGEEGPLNLPELGVWRIANTRLKYFPVAYNTQIGIWAAIELRKQLEASKLERVTLFTSRFLKHESGSEPAKWDPQTRETADHSLPYVFARGLIDGTVNTNSFSHDKIRDPEVLAIMNRVTVEVDDTIENEWPGIIQARAEAVDTDGNTYNIHVTDPKGHENNRLTPEDLETKFKSLTEAALGADQAASAFDAAWRTREAERFTSVLDTFVVQGS